MLMRTIAVISLVGFLLPGLAQADAALDSQVRDVIHSTQQFLRQDPEVEHWANTDSAYVQAWQRIYGLDDMIWLKSYNKLPAQWTGTLNRRLIKLEMIQSRQTMSPAAEQLQAMIQLYAQFARDYMLGSVNFGAYERVASYVRTMGEPFAVKLRGKPYAPGCAFTDTNCKSPPPVWAQ